MKKVILGSFIFLGGFAMLVRIILGVVGSKSDK